MYPNLEVIEVYGISDKLFEAEYLRSGLQLIVSGRITDEEIAQAFSVFKFRYCKLQYRF